MMEFDRSSVQEYEGEILVRERVTFKKAQLDDAGLNVKYLVYGSAFSCDKRTETIKVVRKWSPDRKPLSTSEPKGIHFKALPGSPTLFILNKVCPIKK